MPNYTVTDSAFNTRGYWFFVVYQAHNLEEEPASSISGIKRLTAEEVVNKIITVHPELNGVGHGNDRKIAVTSSNP